MIDHEVEVYDKVVTEVRKTYPTLFCTGEYIQAPPKFPVLSLLQMDNPVFPGAREFTRVENAARPMYELNIYSNKTNGKKSECKEIMVVASDVLTDMGFTRTLCQPIPNVADATIYRMVARFTKVDT